MRRRENCHECEINITLTREKDPKVKGALGLTLIGTYDKESMTIKGTFSVKPGSDESLKQFYTGGDAVYDNSFEIHSAECKDKAQLLYFNKSMHDA